jgi:hypothetical protein
MTLKVWHLTGLALTTVLLASLVLPTQPVVALVAFAGIVAAALLLAQKRGIQLSLETQIRGLLDAHSRERALVKRERATYFERLRTVKQLVSEQQQMLVILVREIDHLTEEARQLAAGGAPPTDADVTPIPTLAAVEKPSLVRYARSA